MKKLVCLIVGLAVIVLFPGVATAAPGDDSLDPIIVTDSTMIPENADFLVTDCVKTYTWDVYTPETGKTEYFTYVDNSACEFLIHPRITVVDRCGWRRDVVRVHHDDRYKSVVVKQVFKARWRVVLIAREGYSIVKPWRPVNRPYAVMTYYLNGSPC
jgi:hypothetical protein